MVHTVAFCLGPCHVGAMFTRTSSSHTRLLTLLAPAAWLLWAPACGGSGGGGASVSAADKAEADKIWTERCTSCHGAQGKGDGPAGQNLNPKPRNMADSAWQSSVNDAHLSRIIIGGGKAVGKSELMPPNADLAQKKGVVDALVAKVRSFGGK